MAFAEKQQSDATVAKAAPYPWLKNDHVIPLRPTVHAEIAGASCGKNSAQPHFWLTQFLDRPDLAPFTDQGGGDELAEMTEWEIPHRIGSSLAGASGSLRVCFAEEKFARAFRHCHGAPADEFAAAAAADADDEALYDRLAGEHDE